MWPSNIQLLKRPSPQQLRRALNMLCFTAAPRDTLCSPHLMQHSRLTGTFRFPDKPSSLQMFTSGACGVWKCKMCNDSDLIFRLWHFLLTALSCNGNDPCWIPSRRLLSALKEIFQPFWVGAAGGKNHHKQGVHVLLCFKMATLLW